MDISFLKQNSGTSQPSFSDQEISLLFTFLFHFYLKCTVLFWISACVIFGLCCNMFQLRMFSFYMIILRLHPNHLHYKSLIKFETVISDTAFLKFEVLRFTKPSSLCSTCLSIFRCVVSHSDS